MLKDMDSHYIMYLYVGLEKRRRFPNEHLIAGVREKCVHVFCVWVLVVCVSRSFCLLYVFARMCGLCARVCNVHVYGVWNLSMCCLCMHLSVCVMCICVF